MPDIEWTQDEETETWTVENVPLIGPGTWNGHEFDSESLARLVENTNKAERRPHLGPGHPPRTLMAPGKEAELESWRTAQPRFGKLGKLVLDGAKVIAQTITDIPDMVKNAIAGRMFGPMSIEALHKNKETGWVVNRVGLLGYVKSAVPWAGITNSDNQAVIPFSFVDGEQLVFVSGEELGVEKKAPATGDGESVHAEVEAITEGGPEMADENKAEARVLAAEREAFDAEQKVAKAAADQLEADRLALAEDRKRLHAAKVDDQWTRLLEAQVVKPAEEKAYKGIAMSLDDHEKLEFADGDKSTALDAHYGSWKTRPVIGKDTKGKPAGKSEEKPDDRTPDEKILAMALELADKQQIPLPEALGIVERDNREVVEEYTKQFSGDAPSEVYANLTEVVLPPKKGGGE